jgi:hypothetical protein
LVVWLIILILFRRVDYHGCFINILASVTTLDIITLSVNSHSIIPIFAVVEAVTELCLAVFNSIANHWEALIMCNLTLTQTLVCKSLVIWTNRWLRPSKSASDTNFGKYMQVIFRIVCIRYTVKSVFIEALCDAICLITLGIYVIWSFKFLLFTQFVRGCKILKAIFVIVSYARNVNLVSTRMTHLFKCLQPVYICFC